MFAVGYALVVLIALYAALLLVEARRQSRVEPVVDIEERERWEALRRLVDEKRAGEQ